MSIRSKLRNKLYKTNVFPEPDLLRVVNAYSVGILNSFFSINSFIPLTQWSISPVGICHILNYITINQPRVIVEFGSGVSTIYISKLLKQNNLDIKFISVDHDENWIRIVKRWTESENILDRVQFLHSPLSEELTYKGSRIKWYNQDVLNKNLQKDSVEFLVIDAPPGDYPYSRAGAFLYFQDQISKASVNYFLDDAYRKEETEIVKSLGQQNLFLFDYCMGGKKKNTFDSTPITFLK
jgi:hypothetical protein